MSLNCHPGERQVAQGELYPEEDHRGPEKAPPRIGWKRARRVPSVPAVPTIARLNTSDTHFTRNPEARGYQIM